MNLDLFLNSKFIGLMLFLIAVVIIGNLLKKDREEKVLKMRKKQASLNIRENAIKKKLELSVEEKANVSKKFRIEEMCIQAGIKITYGEYKLICITVSIVISVLTLMITNNIFLTMLMIFIGYIIPGQIISFIRSRRMAVMEKQIGSFLNLVTERYKSQRDMPKAITDSLMDFKGQEPLYTEIKTTVSEINSGTSPLEALDNLGNRTNNKYLKRFKDYFGITSDIGTDEAREEILSQAFIQFDENRKMKELLKKEISGPVRDSYILIGAIPVMAIYQANTSDTYVDFMINTMTGKIAIAGIVLVVLLAIWFVNVKLGGPLE